MCVCECVCVCVCHSVNCNHALLVRFSVQEITIPVRQKEARSNSNMHANTTSL